MENWRNLQKEDLDGEIWKNCKEANAYEVSNYGRIRNLIWKKGSHAKPTDYPIIIKQYLDKKGYCVAHIVNNNRNKKSIKVHRYVGFAFLENPNNLPQINHIDGIKTNNITDNLEWISNIDNMRHSYVIGLRDGSYTGEKNGRAILTEKEVVYIYTNPDRKTITELRSEFKLSESSISSIYKGKNWKYITKDLVANHISSNDRFFKCLKEDKVFYYNKIQKTREITKLSNFKTMEAIYNNKTYDGWTISYCSYDEYIEGVKNESK
jgi:hypothetical protein